MGIRWQGFDLHEYVHPIGILLVELLETLDYSSTGCRVFKRGGTKLERFLLKNQHTQRKLLKFENWINANGEVSKIEHHFSNKVILKIEVIK